MSNDFKTSRSPNDFPKMKYGACSGLGRIEKEDAYGITPPGGDVDDRVSRPAIPSGMKRPATPAGMKR